LHTKFYLIESYIPLFGQMMPMNNPRAQLLLTTQDLCYMRSIDLSNHVSITSANRVSRIISPLTDLFGVNHFRYLKLYEDHSRILLSNHAGCTRFVYEEENYKSMWYDGEFPEKLLDGWYQWNGTEAKSNEPKTDFELLINKELGLYHGLTFVKKDVNYWEIVTFDSNQSSVCNIDKHVLIQFLFYFKEQAHKLIETADHDRIRVSSEKILLNLRPHFEQEKVLRFLENTRVNRYYLGGGYDGVYLTAKEAQCVYWLVQGKSAEEIALIENNSVKTISRHFENVRQKLNCFKQTDLVRIVLESGIFDSTPFKIQ
jgi:DNA-binding CsgD family transcriptional regulator